MYFLTHLINMFLKARDNCHCNPLLTFSKGKLLVNS